MNGKQAALLTLAALTTLGTSVPGNSAELATRDEAVAMVKRAVAFIAEQGPDKAYAEFTKKAGRFHDRDLYITVTQFDGMILAHGQRDDYVGKSLINVQDPDGKFFIRERRDLSLDKAAFWQQYKFSNPTTKIVESKDMYCERLDAANVCAGVYSR